MEYALKPGSDSAPETIVLSMELAPRERIRSALARCIAASGWSGGPVRIIPDTLKTVLVPAEVFNLAQVVNYLTINNISVGHDEAVIIARLAGGMAVAIIVSDREVTDAVAEMFEDRAIFSSPFESAATNDGIKHRKKDAGREFATICLTGKNVYITVRSIPDGEWRYCEALPYSGTADILYYMQELSARFDIRKTPVCISGPGAEKVEKAVRKAFGK